MTDDDESIKTLDEGIPAPIMTTTPGNGSSMSREDMEALINDIRKENRMLLSEHKKGLERQVGYSFRTSHK